MQTKTPQGLIDAIDRNKHKEYYEKRQLVEYYKRDIQQYQSYIEGNEQAIAEYKSSIKSRLETIKPVAKEEARLAKARDISKVEASATDIWKAILSHKGIESVEVIGTCFKITTRLLFANIRVKPGTPATKRACVGAFEIELPITGAGLNIKNLTFPGKYGMWSIKSGSPCLGEWASEITRFRERGDYFGLIDMFFHYLRAADSDGSAFMASHRWRDEYRDLSHYFRKGNYRTGESVMALNDIDGTFSTKGKVGRLTAVTNERIVVHFRDSIKRVHDTSSSTYELVTRSNFIVPITDAAYEATGEDKSIATMIKRILRTLDSLKEGTQKNAEATIIKQIKKNSKIRLDS